MPKIRTTYLLAPRAPRFPEGFYEIRNQFRDRADLDLFCESWSRFLARDGRAVIATFRSLAAARAWLEAWPVQTPAHRSR